MQPTTAPHAPVVVDALHGLAAPVRALLEIGDHWEGGDLWKGERIDYAARFAIAPEHIPDLIRLATYTKLISDWEECDEEDSCSEEASCAELDAPADRARIKASWCAPIHAWRALAQLRAREAIQPLVGLLNYSDAVDLDWGHDEVPHALGLIGEEGVSAAVEFVMDDDNREFARGCALDAIEHFIDHYDPKPETIAPWAAALTRVLLAPARNGGKLNAFIIVALVKMKATSAAETIERTFAEGWVDESVCGEWEEVRADLFGLPRPPRKRSQLEAMLEDFAVAAFCGDEPEPGREPPVRPASPTEKQWSKARKQRDRKRGKRR